MKKPSPYLTFAGAIPFVVCRLCIFADDKRCYRAYTWLSSQYIKCLWSSNCIIYGRRALGQSFRFI